MNSKNYFDGIVMPVHRAAAGVGLLSGTSFVVKDLFDVSGELTGAGIPDWAKTHPPARKNAETIDMLLAAGAELIGKSCTDQLAFSTDGINGAYGIPVNPNYPGHIPGGSSSGSASAVAAGLCDFSLGTDTLGSIRIPSAYCGIFGFRPTHGIISTEGVVPLGQSFDTVGWMAGSRQLLLRVGAVLLADSSSASVTSHEFCFVSDFLDILHPDLKESWLSAAEKMLSRFRLKAVALPDGALQKWCALMDTIRSYEAWENHGKWMTEVDPQMDDLIKARFLLSQNVSKESCSQAEEERISVLSELDEIMAERILCFPTVWNWPPSCNASRDELLSNRARNHLINITASIGGLPQVSIPIEIGLNSPKFALSLMAARGKDMWLLKVLDDL
ncbi:MAG: hypothetical protein K2X27_21640 [Candidatus Obscuribacterales bacterium]|nr:hypothetical protein [Candidatus Obscuribacterales bacterium]